MYGSGQWTIPDGYVASKLFKGCLSTNNVEANARLCMASAVTGFLTSFGLDEPMGCYEDMDHANVFITWGNNMAEMHPVLFSRMTANRKTRADVTIIDFATRSTRTSLAADKSILFRPQTDLAVANAICHEIIRNGWATGYVPRERWKSAPSASSAPGKDVCPPASKPAPPAPGSSATCSIPTAKSVLF